jgi:hypothetical protein
MEEVLAGVSTDLTINPVFLDSCAAVSVVSFNHVLLQVRPAERRISNANGAIELYREEGLDPVFGVWCIRGRAPGLILAYNDSEPMYHRTW